MRNRKSYGFFLISLILFSLIPSIESRRGGGGGIGGSRGGGSRGSSGGFGSRGSSGARTSSGGGWFGGGSKTNSGAERNDYSRGPNLGNTRQQASGGVWNSGVSSGNWNNNRAGTGMSSGRWSTSGVGSHSRGNTFKNMIVGAAAGYLTYQAGKAIIRAAAGPMIRSVFEAQIVADGPSAARDSTADCSLFGTPRPPDGPFFGSPLSTCACAMNAAKG
ncbi:Protein CBG22465 [Caenorhabditis briggsae]|uniref:Protein CBG22465 n=1 Tax=Caenorhabditis briggsae TaxID=6238 RepID=A8Y2C6_CAEBR|nr:Protein CBG22465 [Caenorhabditis briggsae]CAP39047.2 Protein CBG22465 [Caenorhabditis briggsae]